LPHQDDVVPSRVAKLVGNVPELKLLTSAALIAGLKQVRGRGKPFVETPGQRPAHPHGGAACTILGALGPFRGR
jgi:hypothetical protein